MIKEKHNSVTLDEKNELVRCVQNYEALDAIRTNIRKLNFKHAAEAEDIEAMAAIVGGLIAKCMDEGDQIPVTGE